MDRARAEFMQFQEVQLCSVTFVLTETILWELRTKVTHHSVARHLGDHARRGNAQTDAVAIDDRRLGNWKGNHRQSVDQRVFRWVDQRCDCHTHCSMARAQNIYAIDLDRIDDTNGPCNPGI